MCKETCVPSHSLPSGLTRKRCLRGADVGNHHHIIGPRNALGSSTLTKVTSM